MEPDFILKVLPEHAIDNSLVVPILIGLLILLFFTETFGWVFSGFVVPGYLSVIMISFPEAGLAVIIEAILTYILVYWLSELGSKSGLWSRFFGRDRFLMFVFISLIVRLFLDVLVFPHLSLSILAMTGMSLGDNFCSIGLVLVPLLANSFWKVGLSKGLFQTGMVTTATYLIVNFILLPHTNLDLGRFELTYDNLALNFVLATKIYIIILVSSFLASHWNIRYGWDYHGILVPGLLSVAFFTPSKILFTFVEALVIAILFRLITKLPKVRELNLGGGRRMAFVFSITFIYRTCLAALLPNIGELFVSDVFGFGYLLTTLIAIRIVNTNNASKVMTPIFITSITGMILGVLISSALQWLHPATPVLSRDTNDGHTSISDLPQGPLIKDLIQSTAYIISDQQVERVYPSTNHTMHLAEIFINYMITPTPAKCPRDTKHQSSNDINPVTCIHHNDPVLGEYIVLHEEAENRYHLHGLDLLVIFPGKPGPILHIPHPLKESYSLTSSIMLAKATQACALVISGIDTSNDNPDRTHAPMFRGSVMQTINRLDPRRDVVQIRHTTSKGNRWHIRHKLPDSIRVEELRNVIGELRLVWRPPAETNLQWATVRNTFGIIMLDRQTERKLNEKLNQLYGFDQLSTNIEKGIIEQWFMGRKNNILRSGQELYRPPSWQEYTILRREVFAPLLEQSKDGPCTARLDISNTIGLYARQIGLQLSWFKDIGTRETFMILSEQERVKPQIDGTTHSPIPSDQDSTYRGLGTIVLRCQAANPWYILAPRPVQEIGTATIAVDTFMRYKARALVLPGASLRNHPLGESNLLSTRTKPSLAHGLLWEFLNHYENHPDWLILLIRGIMDPLDEHSITLSSGTETIDANHLSQALRRFHSVFSYQNKNASVFSGLKKELHFQPVRDSFFDLVDTLSPHHYATLWMAQGMRRSILEGSRLTNLLRQFERAGIPYKRSHKFVLSSELLRKPTTRVRRSTLSEKRLKEYLMKYLNAFTSGNNFIALRRLSEIPETRVHAVVDVRASKVYVIAEKSGIRCAAQMGVGTSQTNHTDLQPKDSSICVNIKKARRDFKSP